MVWRGTTHTHTDLIRTSESCLLGEENKELGCGQEPLALDFFYARFTSFHFYFTRFSVTVQMRAAALLYVTWLSLVHSCLSTTSWPRLLAGVVPERDAWSLWSVSQQQTVHTSRPSRGIVAHFRTSVHDTASVVTRSSLVPHQRLNFVHLCQRAHLCASTQA